MCDTLYEPRPHKYSTFISPGPVGVVGDVLCQTRLYSSTPDMVPRYAAWNSGANETFLGSNVRDGSVNSYVSNGGPARTLHRSGGRDIAVGKRIEDMNWKSLYYDVTMGSLGDYDWRDSQASVYESNRTGERFTPLPNGFSLPPGQVRRDSGPLIQQIDGGGDNGSDYDPNMYQSIVQNNTQDAGVVTGSSSQVRGYGMNRGY